ncbi:hypothetical protein O2K51_07950 [Apibacter raozihei]|uniref:hypothetical protein n=1 Tax=Apibacter raozihei TaxID=2500547 RepID=UPI000FE35C0B|nr:hypothetical protein [Apibacter raozihei]
MKKIALLLFAFNVLLITSCKKESNNNNQQISQTENNSSVETNAQPQYKVEYLVKDETGKELGGFSVNPLKVQYENKTYTAKEKEGKRKYYTNGVLSYEVKFAEGTFKLKNADSKLLWKIKIYPDKIKISDNEENLNPYEIRNKDGVFEISKEEKVLHTVNISDKHIQVDKQNKYEISQPIENFAVGILGIDEIPLEQKLFILMEYLYETQ